jgi:hypothetical protein
MTWRSLIGAFQLPVIRGAFLMFEDSDYRLPTVVHNVDQYRHFPEAMRLVVASPILKAILRCILHQTYGPDLPRASPILEEQKARSTRFRNL